jgi:ribosome biogenesis GTPase
MRKSRIVDLYRGIGYTGIPTRAEERVGLDELHERLRGKLSVLTGPSGVGKSSLLNAVWPGLDLRVAEVSEATDRGRHTTVVACLLTPESDTFVADTPGLRQFRFWDIVPSSWRPSSPSSPLPHQVPVRTLHPHARAGLRCPQAAERGQIPPLRYESYLRMFEHGF